MSIEFYSSDSQCPCKSGLQARFCCLPEEAPISARGESFDSIKTDLYLKTSDGRKLPPPPQFNVALTLNFPHQTDSQIEGFAHEFLEQMACVDGYSTEWYSQACGLLGALVDSLYAVRYHQRSFLNRLRLVAMQQTFLFKPPKGKAIINFNDRPMKHELESFLVRTRGTLDSLSKLSSFLLGKSPKTYGKFRNLLEKDKQIIFNVRQKLFEIFEEHQQWIKDINCFRNEIVHEGKFEGFEGIGHRGVFMVDARIAGFNSGSFCIRSWKHLRDIVPGIVFTCLKSSQVKQLNRGVFEQD